MRNTSSPTPSFIPPNMRDLCWRRLGREPVPSCLAVDLSPECGVALVAEVVCEFGRSASRARDNVCRTTTVQFSLPILESGGEGDSLCFSLRPLLELRMRLAPCVVLRFGAARSQGGRRSRKPARVSGIKDASAEGTAVLLLKAGAANAAAKAVYSGAARDDLLLLLEEEAATDVRRTNASRTWRAGRRAVRSAGSAIEAIAIVVPGERV